MVTVKRSPTFDFIDILLLDTSDETPDELGFQRRVPYERLDDGSHDPYLRRHRDDERLASSLLRRVELVIYVMLPCGAFLTLTIGPR